MLDYIRSALSFIFAVSVMYMLLDCEIKDKKNRYLLGLYAAIVFVLDGLFLFHYGYSAFMRLYPLLVQLPVLFAFLFISKFQATKVFFIFVTVIAISTSFSMAGLSIAFLFGFSKDIANMISYTLYLPAWFMVYKYIRQTFLYMLRNWDSGWLGFSMIPISYSVLIYSIGMYDINEVINKFSVQYGVLLFIIVCSAYYLILRFFMQTREKLILQDEQNLLLNQAAAAQLQLEALEASQEKTMLYRHDMRHHLSLIHSYLGNKDYDAAQKYIADVERSIEEATVEKYCSNYTVNLILYAHIKHAKTEGIQVETHVNLPEKSVVSDMDLCVLLGNALENATNACADIPNKKDRFLKISCRTKHEKLMIQITNSCNGKVAFSDNMPISSTENHGLGTRSIAAIAQKYSGLCSFGYEDGCFTTSVIL